MQGGITMTVLDAIKARHSVRRYQNIPLDPVTTAQLQHDIEQCNEKYNLSIQLGKFSGVRNYIALVGAKTIRHCTKNWAGAVKSWC